MGLHFGNLAKVTGITYFRLSPYEQRAFAGLLDGSGRWVKRMRSGFLRAAPFFMGTYMAQAWATETNHKLHRKDPKDYENDQ
ncbi:cytochrome b-c1 complex subunit 8 [Ceratina calcarata]|uniref:Cytochrome b-c1 complex subunit 8 n=1 Tax=Ceratina calcarata TaxID=156304 RepID=A0AAJ7N4Q4_9HYME|nr:cytochrome b-c1 complex subunit 8 [Ceratina calcarata]XP_017876777.1 cytochrome b-c1 complex subunit 8 [Ceratina calcarata]